MVSELRRGPMLGGNEGSFGDELEKELGLLLHEQRPQEADGREKELNLYRSGSAPPTVEGSLSAVDGLFNNGGSGSGSGSGSGGGFSEFGRNKSVNGFLSEEELRSDPAYLSYYYSNVNLNPRLPPPMISKEDWRSAQRLQGGNSDLSGIGDRRKLYRNDSGSVGRSVLSMPPGFKSKKGERVSDSESDRVCSSVEWGDDGLIGLPALRLAGKQKSFSEIFQDDYGRSIPASGHPSHPASRNAFDDNNETLGSGEAELTNILSDLSSTDTSQEVNIRSLSSTQNDGQLASYAYDPQLIARTPSPSLGPIGGGRVSASAKRSVDNPNSFNGVSSTMSGSTNLVASLSSMNLSNGVKDEDNHFPSKIEQDVYDPKNYLFSLQGGSCVRKSESGNFNMPLTSNSPKVPYSDSNRSKSAAFSPNSPYRKAYSTSSLNNEDGVTSQYQHMGSPNSSFSNYGLGGYSTNNYNLPPLYENVATASAMAIHGMDSRISNSQNPSRIGTHMVGNALQESYVDPLYLQYMRTADHSAAQAVLNNTALEMNYLGNPYMSLLQKAHLGTLLSPQKSQYASPLGTKSSVPNHHGYYGTPAYEVGLSYPGSPLASPVIPNSSVGPRSPMRHGMRNLAGGVMGAWNVEAGSNMDDSFTSSLIAEFRNNKMKCFELSEVTGHIVEFSADQYGSRFIQQKLETATTEEKNMVFDEIIPQALTLMTDVFGNYVIQKFFEHGFASQIRELASNLFGHVLTLSLQMYGCRVIQKAIEVVDLDQKIKMVEELDGNVMRCVRDQNGNHVIQKCIECVPEEHIQFIVSTFFDQVVTLSTHPYGCRVIQRVLEHCIEPKTQSKVMDEILGSVSMLAQDQYGNYVIQHILEHGKPHEQSTIIKELAGKIVQMSQQKFASNVVEKCLTFGGPAECQLLVTEMLGSTDENEPLQAMMKDQFANYVVQKVLETCDDQQRELILSRIKVHLNALKKYTYGKHIVARVEKLVVAGERRIAAQSPYPT